MRESGCAWEYVEAEEYTDEVSGNDDRVKSHVVAKVYAQTIRCGCGDPLSHEGVCPSPVLGVDRLVDYQHPDFWKHYWGLYKHGLLWSKLRRNITNAFKHTGKRGQGRHLGRAERGRHLPEILRLGHRRRHDHAGDQDRFGD